MVAIPLLLTAWGRGSGHASDVPPLVPPQVQRPLELEDWPAVLEGLTGDPLTNSVVRLVAVRALFETGHLPDAQFARIHSAGPDLLSTSELDHYAGAAYLADALLQLGFVHAAERLAFDSLEMEGESPPALRTLARLHLAKGLTNAAGIFLNRLEAYPEHQAWIACLRTRTTTGSPAAGNPELSRIQANLVTRDQVAAGLTTERLLRMALEANPTNRMAVQFLMAQQLLARDLLRARQTLAGSPQTAGGPLPRHYAEAVLLHRILYPGIPVDTLLARVPPEVMADFQRLRGLLAQAKGGVEQARLAAWPEFGNTYWYYYFFGSRHSVGSSPTPDNSATHE